MRRQTFYLAAAIVLATAATAAQACPGFYDSYSRWHQGYFGPCGPPVYGPGIGMAPYPGWVWYPRWGWHAPHGRMYWRQGWGWHRW